MVVSSVKQLDAVKWPSGRSRTIAYLRLSPADLDAKYGLKFARGIDDLDHYEQAIVRLGSGRTVTLVRYRGEQEPGTAVEVDSGDNAAAARAELQRTLNLRENDYSWIDRAGATTSSRLMAKLLGFLQLLGPTRP